MAPQPPGLADNPPPDPTVTPLDDETRIAAAYYGRIEAGYLSRGQLRNDGGGPDTPFTAADLARNVAAIAFHDEFSEIGGRLVASNRENRLHRWAQPIRLAVEFGASVPLDQRRADRSVIQSYIARLSRLSGLPIRLVADRPNFLVLIENPAERRSLDARIRAFRPDTSEAAIRSVVAMAPATYCTAFSYTAGGSGRYDRALAVIRGELPDLMRQACIEEEIAQALGLVNDSSRARPSIFNDNQEFGTLTRQDELMIRLLYDPRLRPGMALAEARPIIDTIAAELVPGDS
ncbi:DUF2927 domain-containing protein [Frigidibacter sp. RF13]|uniref:DUF2927 domain-containing protein n=1 Tax=Frigidibacter sp. RF13 TaxID=2997340 RepID=UPI00226F6790|nr:DUF2927 domain-containing protein [Frigidibacter sp. RF13]MCY1125556.1 DUF2927 domain-containing protein [Frigidibacter sp. RF13]